MPRFVLLYHDCPADYSRQSHWDLMLEDGGALRTWAVDRLPKGWNAAQAATTAVDADCPAPAGEDCVTARQLGDHRSDYLEYEGRLSGNRGSVTRVVAGYFATEIESPYLWRLSVSSDMLAGALEMRRADSESTEWTLNWFGRD
jgi:hypothetical protein